LAVIVVVLVVEICSIEDEDDIRTNANIVRMPSHGEILDAEPIELG
jgi:hypothetical protein